MANSNIVQVIQQICKAEREAAKPVDIVIGSVASASPLTVKMASGLELASPFLIFTKTATDRNLSPGDAVVMIRAQGGQKFLVIDKAG